MFQSVQGIASNLGKTFREVYEFNSGSIPFKMPSQVSAGLDLASQYLKTPTASELESLARGEVDNILGGLRSSKVLTDAYGLAEQAQGSLEETISKISWLL